MTASNISIVIVLVLFVGISAQVPTVIPFLGTGSVSTPTLSVSSIGQLITKVSDIQSFTFFVLGLANGNGLVTVAKWSTPETSIKSVSFVLPFAYSYTPITVNLNVEELDPDTSYVVYVTFQAEVKDRLHVATKTTGGVVGGLIKFFNGVWNAKYPEDLVFELTSNNVLKLYQPNFSYGRAAHGWQCEYNTTFSAIQVNWATNIANTGYFKRSTTTFVKQNTAYTCAAASNVTIPFGTAARCYGSSSLAPGKIDLRGTSYKVVAAQFAAAGYGSYATATYSSNNQVVDLLGGGSCGWVATTTANAGGEDNAIIYGGFYLNLTRV